MIKEKLFQKLKIKPKNYSLYVEAFTHPSYTYENGLKYSYQRLEFLGDSVISKIVADFLYKKYPNMNEGELSNNKSSIVKGKSLIYVSKSLKLNEFILVGKSLNINQLSGKIFEDVFEALIGAIYLDQGESVAARIIKDHLISAYLQKTFDDSIDDYKTLFQEAVDRNGKNDIKYISNFDHNKKEFDVELFYNGIIYGKARDRKLKEAEKMAAKIAYSKLVKLGGR